jgi:two-component system NtrC family response regulator
MKKGRILVVDDEENLRRVLQVQLEGAGYQLHTAADASEALSLLERLPIDLVLTDFRMPGRSGLDLLREIRSRFPSVQAIMMTAFGTVEDAVEAMRAGAYHYVTKPVHLPELLITIDRVLEHCRLLAEVTQLRESLNEKYVFENIIGQSGALLDVLDIASRAARSTSTVLIEGETGTGKELLARAIHFNSRRRDRPFIAINCGAIPRDLLESELFGYRKGAFTGALENKTGKVEAAAGGTLFLDEIGELPLELQVKLLRLLQEGEINKLGAVEPQKVDVRIVAATNRNLRTFAENGGFREDLYYRLAVIPMTLPPLRERPADIPLLVQHFWERSKVNQERPGLALPHALLPWFTRYHWPGNIRELENILERIVVLSRGPEVTLADLPPVLREPRPVLDAIRLELPAQGISLDAVEKELIVRSLQRFSNNQTRAADYLGLTRKTLIYRMEKHGIR